MNNDHPSLPRLISLLAVLFAGILILFGINKKEPAAISGILKIKAVEPELFAHGYFVKIIGESQPLLKRREWKKLPPASLTKILTSVVAVEELSPAEYVTFSENVKTIEEKLSPFSAGDKILRDEAIKLTLLGSANDAALALAERVGEIRGGNTFADKLAIFKTLMNQKAWSIGLYNSYFQNPTGLDEEGQYTSAEDLARLAEYVWYNHPELWEISRTSETAVMSLAPSPKERRIVNTNKLLEGFPAMRGGKTGFTDNAKETFIFLYPVRPNKNAVIVILGSGDRFEDGKRIIRWLEQIQYKKE